MASKRSGNKAKSGGGAKRESKAGKALKDLQVRNAKGTAIKGGSCTTGQHYPEPILIVR